MLKQSLFTLSLQLLTQYMGIDVSCSIFISSHNRDGSLVEQQIERQSN